MTEKNQTQTDIVRERQTKTEQDRPRFGETERIKQTGNEKSLFMAQTNDGCRRKKKKEKKHFFFPQVKEAQKVKRENKSKRNGKK